jgi:paraquat-inducible protein A
VFAASAQPNIRTSHTPLMPDTHFACRDCGQIYLAGGELLRRGSLRCRRCGTLLWRTRSGRFADPRAFAITGAILLALANTFPLFAVSVAGDHRSGVIADGAAALFGYGGGISAVGGLVAVIAVAIPALDIALTLVTLLYVGARSAAGRSRRLPPGLATMWLWAVRLRPWSMLDVFLLGAVVAYTRLGQLAQVGVAIGGYALAGFVLIQVLLEETLGRQLVWNQIADPAKYAPAPGEPWMLCLDCDLVVGARHANAGAVAGRRRRCPRCGTRLDPRRPASLAFTAALTLAGFILYFPANLFPVLTITRFGRSEAYTILGGVRDLAQAGLWPLALLVLLASIVVPVLKLAGLTWCVVAIRLRSARWLRQRTKFYRFIDYIGRWSNIDVFVVALVTAMIQFGTVSTVEPGPGIASFAAVVVLTMIAADAFDPRLMWDAAAAGRPG